MNQCRASYDNVTTPTKPARFQYEADHHSNLKAVEVREEVTEAVFP